MSDWRSQLVAYIRAEANPIDKYSHQPRLYRLACSLSAGQDYDDDILFAACWLHDLGVFIGHRPEDLAALARWDNVAYVLEQAPGLLKQWGFPTRKIQAVLDAIRQHAPNARPQEWEAQLLHDADLLEQLGAIGLLRTISKVGRDTRYPSFADLRPVWQQQRALPQQLLTDTGREAALARIALLEQFIRQLDEEAPADLL